jgi:hypothetical protein
MNTIEGNGLSYLWTAEQVNKYALRTDKQAECSVPDAKTASEYIKARRIRECWYGGTPFLLDRSYTSEEVEEYYNKEKNFMKMNLDMRDQIVVDGNGRKGLQDVCGTVLIEPQFDDIPELYSCFERCNLIPVVLNGRYFLYDIREHKLLAKGYNRIFRYFWANIDYFVAAENDKKGILHGYDGTEVTPIDLDEVYEMQDPDGVVPYVKDGKIGFVLGRKDTKPVFDKVVIESENYTRVLMNGKWGRIDQKGNFTSEESKAAFGSWYDLDK